MATDQSAYSETEATYTVTAFPVGPDEVGPRNDTVAGAANGPHAFRVVFGDAILPDALPETFDVHVRAALPEGLGVRLRHPLLALHMTDADHDGVFVVTDDFSTVYGEVGHDLARAMARDLKVPAPFCRDLDACTKVRGRWSLALLGGFSSGRSPASRYTSRS